MIEISFGKLILLALVALIVLGPEKLPGAARTAGALLRRLRSGWDNVRAEVERELEIEEIRRAAREAAAHAEAAQAELNNALRQVRDPLAQAVAKTSEPYRLTGEAPIDEPSSVAENTSLSDESAARDGARPEREREQSDGLPLTSTLSPENSLGREGAARGESGIAARDARLSMPDPHATGQLFEAVPPTPVAGESTPAATVIDAASTHGEPQPTFTPALTKSSAHGGH